MNTDTFDFAITHISDESIALKHVSIPGDSFESAESFASDELEEYKKGLVIKKEEFEQKEQQKRN